MKKSLVVILSMLLVLGLSVSAFALHQSAQTEYEPGVASNDGVLITLGGSIRVRGELKNNTADQNDDHSDRSAAMDSRVRISLKAQTSKNTYGFIELENGNFDDWWWKDSDTADTYTWGANTASWFGGPSETGATGFYQNGNAKRGDLRIRQAYIAHQGEALGMLTGVKAGHMLLGLGEGLFFDHTKFGDDAILVWSEIPGTDGEMAFTTIKLSEGNSAAGSGICSSCGGPTNAEADDATAYVLMASLPGDKISISGDITFLDDQDYSSGLGIAGSDTEGLHFWNFGVRANAQPMDNLSLKADVELQKGKAKLNRVDLSGNPADREFSGYAWLIGADLDLNDTYALNAEAAYGSGDKVDYSPAAATDPSGEKFEGFVTSLGGSQHYTYVYEYRTASAAGAKGTGLTNTWYLNLGASAKATSDISVSTDLYFLRAAKAVAIGGALNSDGTLNTSKKLGTEIDAKIEYQIEKNLVYYVEGGYLFTGDAYDYPQVCSSTSCPIPGGGSVLQGDEIPGANETSDNAYAVRNGLMLSF